MVAFALFALGNNGQSTTANTINFTIPAAAQTGDVAYASLGINGGAVSVTTVPTGWTNVFSLTAAGSTQRTSLYQRILPGTPGSTSTAAGTAANFGLSGTVKDIGIMAVITGTDNPPVFASNSSGAATALTTLVSPTVTTTQVGDLILEFFMGHTATTINGAGSVSGNITNIGFASTNYAGSVNLTAQAAYRTVNAPTAGSYGGDTATYTNSNNAWCTYTIAIKNAPAAATPVTFITYRPPWRS